MVGLEVALSSSGPLAQLAEQQTLNLRVLGSIPRRLTIHSKPLLAIARTRNVWLWLCLGCVRVRQRVVETVHGDAIRARNQMPRTCRP